MHVPCLLWGHPPCGDAGAALSLQPIVHAVLGTQIPELMVTTGAPEQLCVAHMLGLL